jgi:uncharacterized membrane protein
VTPRERKDVKWIVIAGIATVVLTLLILSYTATSP